MPHSTDYCIFKISVRALECVYTSKTTALIIGSKYPQHCHSKDKVIWTASICLPGTHQLEQGPWLHENCGRKGQIQKTSENSNIFSKMHKISTLSHYHFILLFIISSCVHYCSVLFPCDCLTFWIFVTIIYISLINMYYVLCMCCHFLLLTNLSTM